ncbi:PDZ domain-containing protein [Leeia sp. TBRC 13508]|uniref:Probable periplasmic serine endoprotease DegP-like n=1 Tax=Leeia speluncae TaxID=2884804 RepID=A0ABS8D2N5_9NEIS|nr:trypsin-like peptidase domain-containing protein [Leeia speluncae]MCB6182248.1 PDZ domain-containing protein [Leeia speluncae]
MFAWAEKKKLINQTIGVFVLTFSFQVQALDLPDITDLVERQSQVVVNINTTQPLSDLKRSTLESDLATEYVKKNFPQVLKEVKNQSLGSGLLISSDGYVVSSSRNIEGVDDITVKLADKREFKARLIGVDRRLDLALLKIPATNVPKANIADVDRIKLGEWVVAIGAPFAGDSAVSLGVVSSKGRSISEDLYIPFIQSDLSTSSGSALFNSRGEVVGVNAQIGSSNINNRSASFFIPIDMVLDVVTQLKANAKLTSGKLGLVIQNLVRDPADATTTEKNTGVLVVSVDKNSLLDKAGLKAGDIILSLNGKPVISAIEFQKTIGLLKTGARGSLSIQRATATKEISFAIAEPVDEKSVQIERNKAVNKPDYSGRLGVSLTELNANQKRVLDIPFGLVVSDVQPVAQKAGMQEGDVVIGINNESIKSLVQFNQYLDRAVKGTVIALLVKREDSTLFIPVKIQN